MKIRKIRRKDKGLGMKTGRIKQAELLRRIQKEDGSFRCFDPANEYCDPWNCYFREVCLTQPKS